MTWRPRLRGFPWWKHCGIRLRMGNLDSKRGRRAAGIGLAALALAFLQGCSGSGPPSLVSIPADAPGSLVFEGVTVIDVVDGIARESQDVWIEGETIRALGPSGTLDAPADARRIDGRGKSLVPGLVDMHAHIGSGTSPPWAFRAPDPERNLEAFLYCGVTTVLDPAAMPAVNVDLRERVDAGEIPGPRIYTAGAPITAVGGHPVPLIKRFAPWWIRWYVLWKSTEQVRRAEHVESAVVEQAGMGVDFVKVMVDAIPDTAPVLREKLIAVAAEEAHERGLRVAAHIGTTDDAVVAARSGVDLWAHGVYRERIADPRIAELAGYGIPMIPTLTVFEYYATAGAPREFTALERETVPPEVLAEYDERPDDFDPGPFEVWTGRLSSLREPALENVRRLHAAGVVLFTGSDTQTGVFPGAGLHRELALLAEAGLPPLDVLRAATIAPARFLTSTDDPEFGAIAPGKAADALLVAGNPLEDIGVLSTAIEMVVHRGVVLDRSAVSGS